MRFSSILALGAFLVPAFASPLLDNNNVEVEAVNDIITKVTTIAPVAIKRSEEIVSPADVVEVAQGLLVSIKVHTAIINQTCSDVPVGEKPTEEQIALIKVQLNVIVDLVKTVTVALGACKSVLKFADAEVAKLVDIVVCIVLEIACTLLNVVKSLNIKLLLVDIISNLCQVLAGLILILEHLVRGLLPLVLSILNVPCLLGIVSSILGNLLVSLTTGKLLVL